MLADAARGLPVLEDRYREQLGGWLEKVAHTVAEIGRERSDLLGRLRRIAQESQVEVEHP
jgi:hypothetical protein